MHIYFDISAVVMMGILGFTWSRSSVLNVTVKLVLIALTLWGIVLFLTDLGFVWRG